MNEENIFLAALEKVNPADRAAYLDAACAGDAALRERVEALLRSHGDPDSFLDRPALLRRAGGRTEGDRTTDLPAGAAASAGAGAAAEDEPLAFLAPGGGPGALGRLDHYEVLEVVGRGGMGVVFKARDTRLQRVVAVKVLAARLAASGTARQRFFREARAAAAVRDEHVVSIHAVSDEGGPTPYLVMEFIAGITLEKRIRERGPLAAKEVLRIGLQAALGLASAHRQGLIHRDVKPANILLENGVERVKLTDFGLARAADDASLSQAGVIAGTPLYMSPEQARGEPLDPRSDLFSLGSVLYTLCTGQPPFAAGGTMAVLRRVCERVARPIRAVNPEVPEWLAAVVDRLLAKDPGARFQTAGELAAVLGRHLARLQQSGQAPAQEAAKPEAAPPAAPAPPARKRKRLALAVGLLGVVGLAAGLATVAALNQPLGPAAPRHGRPVPPAPDPRVLTVSQRPEDGGRFRTIQEALDTVGPGMTIRVLDDAVYDEFLQIDQPERHQGVTLESAGKASLRRVPGKLATVWIRGVPRFTLRGFRFEKTPNTVAFREVYITNRCPGVVLDRLDMAKCDSDGVVVYDVPLSGKDDPIVIQNCTIHVGEEAVVIKGRPHPGLGDPYRPLPCGHVVIRNNEMVHCNLGVVMTGAVHKVHVVGNRILDCQRRAIELEDLLEGAADILVANNTVFRCESAVGIWDDHVQGKKEFLRCKNIRVQNNLVFATLFPADMVLSKRPRGDHNAPAQDGDLNGLLHSPEWLFSHNWREVDEQTGARVPGRWIPYSLTDHPLKPDMVLSLESGDPNFLRPAKDSPLATGGAGVTDPTLPAYVGAVPPEGVAPWDWERTWRALAR
jgi:tRNA A-37 threonylcarbamoyl transferase component Bud32